MSLKSVAGQPLLNGQSLSKQDAMDIALPDHHALFRRREAKGAEAVEGTLADKEMVAACCQGDQRAMDELYRQFRRRVYGIVTRVVGAADAPEVAQEAFIRVYRGLPKFRHDCALSTWVYRLAVNASLTYVTRRARRRETSDEDLARIPAPQIEPRDPKLAARLQWALNELPPGYRAVLVLHDVDGLSHEECAAILGCRVGTSKSQLHKARARMRQLLAPDLAGDRLIPPGGR